MSLRMPRLTPPPAPKGAPGRANRMAPLHAVRSDLVAPGDLRAEIGFQNDINGLMAALEASSRPWTAIAPLLTPAVMRPRKANAAITARLRAFRDTREEPVAALLAAI